MSLHLFEWLKSKLPTGKLAKRVMLLAGGTAIAQAITVLVSPILTRQYTDAEFGVLAVFSSILLILTVVACGSYEVAIPVPKDNRKGFGLLVLSIILAVAASLAVAALVLPVGPLILTWTDTPALGPYLWLVPIALIGSGVYTALSYWAIRQEAFRLLSLTRVTQSISRAVVSVGVGLFHLGPIGLLAGAVMGMAGGSLSLARIAWQSQRSVLLNSLSCSNLKSTAKEFAKFPLYQAPAGLLNTASNQLPALLLSGFFGASVLGQYYLAQRLMLLTSSVIGQALSQAFYQHAAACSQQGGDLRRLVLNLYRRLALPLLAIGALICLVAPNLMMLVFGPNWQMSGQFIRLILPWLIAMLLVSPTTAVFLVQNRSEVVAIYSLVILVARIAAIAVGAKVLHSPYWAVGLFSLVGLAGSVYLGILAVVSAGKPRPLSPVPASQLVVEPTDELKV